MNPLPSVLLRTQPESMTVDVRERQRWSHPDRVLKKAGQRDAGLPIQLARECLCENPVVFVGGVRHVHDWYRYGSVALLIRQVERIGPGESADSDRSAERRVGLPNVAFQLHAVRLPIGTGEIAIREFSGLVAVQSLIRREIEPWSPVEPRSGRERGSRNAEIRKVQLHFAAPRVLRSRAAERDGCLIHFRAIVVLRAG